mgnify:CR=1 FL=1|jgi:hypothetical protein
MGRISCKGSLCWDEDTGRAFFLPDRTCDPKAYAKVRNKSVETGIGFGFPANDKEKDDKK